MQNTHRGIKSLGWAMDWARFIVYLREKYSVSRAYVFMGYIPENEGLYVSLRESGYELVCKPVVYDAREGIKGNCDADMVLQALISMDSYDKALIVTGDGDFYSLVRYLYENEKLRMVLCSHIGMCSRLLRKEAKEKINFMSNMQKRLSWKQDQAVQENKNEKAPHEDETS